MAATRVRPVSPRVLCGLGATATLIIKRLQGGRHGRLINAIVYLEIVGLLVKAGGIDVISAGHAERGKISPPNGVSGNSGGIRSLASDVSSWNSIGQDAGAGVIDANDGSGVRGEKSDLGIGRSVAEIINFDLAGNVPSDGNYRRTQENQYHE